MTLAQVQFVPWDKPYYFLLDDLELQVGDRVIAKTDQGNEIGLIAGFVEAENAEEFLIRESKSNLFINLNTDSDEKEEIKNNENNAAEVETEIKSEIKPVLRSILRKATANDLEKLPKYTERLKVLEQAKKMKDKYGLPMKFFDVHFSFDGSRLTLAFIADGRIDFRELVKDLTRYFGRTIRLQQIGIRDEAKIMGDYGHCGQLLCCRRFLREFNSITSEIAELQQCSHRGSDRISGVCGRLMCCLHYEQQGYKDLALRMPPLGVKVDVDGKKGEVVGHHVLKQTVDVKFGGENGEEEIIVEVDLNRKMKK